MRWSSLFALCEAALEAPPEPLCTRRLARHVITAQGWDSDDTRLRLAVSHKVGTTMACMSLRGAVRKVGERRKASVWQLTHRDARLMAFLESAANFVSTRYIESTSPTTSSGVGA